MNIVPKTFCLLMLGLSVNVAADDGRLLLSGSTTLVPIVSNAANAFMDQYQTWDQVDSSLPPHPVRIETTGGGSGGGVRSVLDDVADIGMVSRDLRAEEMERLGDHRAVRVGVDAVALAAHADNPLHEVRSDLSREEIAAIMSGRIDRYSEFDGSLPDQEIVLLVRDASAGSAVMIQRQILGDEPVSPGALQMSSQGQLVRTLTGNPAAFAYISLGLVNARDELSAFAVDGVEASQENVLSGDYTLARPMLLVMRGEGSPYAQAFVDYILDAGQEIVIDQGYIPVTRAE